MKFHSILLVYFICLAPFLVQEGESVIWVVGASTTVSLGGLILGGLLLKAGAVGIVGLASLAGRRRGGHRRGGYRRGKREISEGLEVDDIDMELLQKEAEMIFRQLDETDPAHCFRRYICELSTGKLENVPQDHIAILNLVSEPVAVQSKAYEYRMASLIGEKTKNLESCQELYQCPMSGEQIDKLFV